MKKKKFKVFSKKKGSFDISLQHKIEASYKFSKKKLLHLADFRAGAERLKYQQQLRYMTCTSEEHSQI